MPRCLMFHGSDDRTNLGHWLWNPGKIKQIWEMQRLDGDGTCHV